MVILSYPAEPALQLKIGIEVAVERLLYTLDVDKHRIGDTRKRNQNTVNIRFPRLAALLRVACDTGFHTFSFHYRR